MHIIDKVWSKGDGLENEDIANQVGHFAWVLDGATAVIKHDIFTPRWLVEEADKVLAMGAKECHSLQDLMGYYIHNFPQSNECNKLMPEQKPSFAGAIIHVDNNSLEHFHLADCYTILKQDENISILRDEDYAVRSKHDAPTLQPGFYDLSKEEKLDLMIQRRCMMNTPQGYWVGTADGEAFKHIKPQKTTITSDAGIILCSDGFEAAVALGLYSWKDTFVSNLTNIVDHLRTAEKSSTQNLMRMKRSDDATAIKLAI